MNVLSTLLLIAPEGAPTLHDVVGIPDTPTVMAQSPRRVQVLLLGTVHQAHAIDSKADPDHPERIEVTTACGLTGTTNLWRYPTFQMLTSSAAWEERISVHGHSPPCPRCFPANADGDEVADG